MIKFFRHIRKSMIIDLPAGKAGNKTSKYLLYAIGEIVLVVIGILIALQINNTNESKKDRVFELKMLSEVRNALENDIKYFYFIENRLHKLDSASNVFIRGVHEKKIFNDTLYTKGSSRWYYLRTGINIITNSGPYEALKSSGIDKVANDSLRNSLVDFYDFNLPRGIALVNYYDRNFDEEVALLKSFLEKPYTEVVNGKIEVYSKFPSNLFLNTDFLYFLTRVQSRAYNSKRILKRIIDDMEKLKNQINSEINL